MKRRGPNLQTQRAINFYKTQYRRGRRYKDGHAVRRALLSAFPGSYEWTSLHHTTRWCRMARQQLALEEVFVTQPVAIQGFERNASADNDLANVTQRAAAQHILTEAEHQQQFAEALALRVGALPSQIRKEAYWRQVVGLLELIVAESSSPTGNGKAA